MTTMTTMMRISRRKEKTIKKKSIKKENKR
jgi:hypothetical protein